MNTMLELSMDADYDVIAAASIITIAILGKAWLLLKKHLGSAQMNH